MNSFLVFFYIFPLCPRFGYNGLLFVVSYHEFCNFFAKIEIRVVDISGQSLRSKRGGYGTTEIFWAVPFAV
jgi:hypothetical protein